MATIPGVPALPVEPGAAVFVRRDWRVWLCGILVASQFFVAVPELKLALQCFAAACGVAHLCTAGFQISRNGLRLFGMLLFGVAYLVCPYWSIAVNNYAGVVMWVLLAIAGVAWLACMPKRLVHEGGTPVPFYYFVLPVLGMLILIWNTLSIPAAWLGDEYWHIRRICAFYDAFFGAGLGWLLPTWVVLAIVVPLILTRSLGTLALGLMLFAALVGASWLAGHANADGALSYLMRRYPALVVWPQLLASWCPSNWGFLLTTDPAYSRIFPALCTVLLCLLWASRLSQLPAISQRHRWVLHLFTPLALATSPVILFYSSIPYLEMALLPLMVWVCLEGHRLIESYLDDRPVGPAWFALAAIPFVKEASLVLCAAFVGVAFLRVLFDIVHKEPALLSRMWRFVKLAVFLFVPLMLYLYYRKKSGSVQGADYQFVFENFTRPEVYSIMAQAMWKQCGLVGILGAWGLIETVRRQRWQAVLCVTILVGYTMFYYGFSQTHVRVAEGVYVPAYAGHARFALFMAAPVLALAWCGLIAVIRKSPRWAAVVMLIVILGNLSMSPLRLDGTRVSGWADFVTDSEVHYYPYEEFYTWMQARQGGVPAEVAVIGRQAPYPDNMYVARYGLSLTVTDHLLTDFFPTVVNQPLGPESLLEDEFAAAIAAEPDYVVIHEPVWGPRWPHDAAYLGYELARTFTQHGLRLIVYAYPRVR